jgi:hypothetical protein
VPAYRLLFVSLFTALLTTSFYGNTFGIAEQGWFERHQRDTEAHVLGRIVIARSHGLFSYGGLPGIGDSQPPALELHRGWPDHRKLEKQYQAFLEDTEFEHFNPYMSQPGMQAIMFSIGDRLLPVSNKAKLNTFRFLTSFLTAAILSLALLWLLLEMGFLAAALAGISLLISQWLCVFGRNLWWSTWSFYLPMVAVMVFLYFKPVSRCKYRYLALIVLLSMFVKCMITGYEYLTTTCVMMVVPLAYYQAKSWPGAKRFALQWSVAIGVSVLAVLLSMTVLCFQIGSMKDGPGDGIGHIRHGFGKRSRGAPEHYEAEYRRSLESDTGDVIRKYNEGVFVFVDRLPFFGKFTSDKGENRIRYIDLIVTFAIATGLGVVLLCIPVKTLDKRLISSAMLATWLGILAPYSWFVVFKAHSFVHYHMNYITWQMPFTVFGFALVGLVFSQPVKAAYRRRKVRCDTAQITGDTSNEFQTSGDL